MSRTIQIVVGAVLVAVILGAILYQGVESTVFFYTPNEVLAAPEEFRGKTIRIGALVEPDSTTWNEELVRLEFRVTEDARVTLPVLFEGAKPDMFREGQGVVVEGSLGADGRFVASTVLVKHSEEYQVDQAKRHEKEAIYRTLTNR